MIIQYGILPLADTEQSGAVEACWAHNPEVRGSKPRSAKVDFFGILERKIKILALCRFSRQTSNRATWHVFLEVHNFLHEALKQILLHF